MKWFYILPIVLLIIIGYGYYEMSPRKTMLGEASFYKDDNIELKVVLMHENLPLHYVGNRYSVACQSQNTKGSLPNDDAEWKFDLIGKDWNRVPGGYLGNGVGPDKEAVLKSLVAEAKNVYLVKDKMTFVFMDDTGINVTFDGCGTFKRWSLEKDLSADLSPASTLEFERCVEQQKEFGVTGLAIDGNCSRAKFYGENKPVFQDVVASSTGHAAFKVSSSAFKDKGMLNVETNDFGKTWQAIMVP